MLSNFIPAATVRTIEAQSSLFVAWEQVLDASVKVSIQHAATKVTNGEDCALMVRQFVSSP